MRRERNDLTTAETARDRQRADQCRRVWLASIRQRGWRSQVETTCNASIRRRVGAEGSARRDGAGRPWRMYASLMRCTHCMGTALGRHRAAAFYLPDQVFVEKILRESRLQRWQATINHMREIVRILKSALPSASASHAMQLHDRRNTMPERCAAEALSALTTMPPVCSLCTRSRREWNPPPRRPRSRRRGQRRVRRRCKRPQAYGRCRPADAPRKVHTVRHA